jgi:hypothetical protein
MQTMWLEIDVLVGLPRVLRRKTALPTSRGPHGGLSGCYPLPDGTACDGRPPIAHPVVRKYHGTTYIFFQEYR